MALIIILIVKLRTIYLAEMNKILFFLAFIIFGASNAQTRVSGSELPGSFSLQECIDYALKNNLSLKQAQASVSVSQIQFEQSKFQRYPSVNAQAGLNGNAGRNVDPFSNSIVTNAIGTNNMGIGANLTIFNGYQIQNSIARNELNLSASQMDVEAQKNNVALQVAVAYLNVLSSEDLIDVAKKQLEVTNIQLERTQKLVKAGALPETNLFDLDAQLANDELSVINAENSLETAKLTLKQAINAPLELEINVRRIDLPNPNMLNYSEKANDIYRTAIGYLPEIKAGEIRMKAADRNIAIAQALGKPTISLNSSWGTAYSSVAKRITNMESTFNPIAVSAEFEGQTIPFVINFPQQTFDRENIPYFNQLGNNQNLNVGLAIRIPIFNAYNQKYQTQSAKIQKIQTDLQNETAKLQIKQNIDQAYINMLNAQKRYSATLLQTEALEKSFKAADSRYNAGASTFVDYNLAKTNLDRAKSNLIVAKYDYIFRIKILDFYQNKPLEF
jgi:outer membrane protein